MGNWLERLNQAKREKDEKDQQRKATELDRQRREISLAREKEQQELLFVEQKRVSLRRDLARFEPNTLLADIKQRVWKKGVLKQWEYIGPSDARRLGYYEQDPTRLKHATESLWYVAMGLVHQYVDRITEYSDFRAGGYAVGSHMGTSFLSLVIGVGDFLPNNERMVFICSDVPYGGIHRSNAITRVSDPAATLRLQDALIKAALAKTPSSPKGRV